MFSRARQPLKIHEGRSFPVGASFTRRSVLLENVRHKLFLLINLLVLLSCLKPMHFTCSQHQADFNNTHDSGGQNISRSQAQHASHEFNSASLMHATSTESKQHAYDDLHPTDEFSTTMDGWCSDGVVRRDRVTMMVAVSPEYPRLAKKATTTTTTTVTNERTNERKNGRTTERTKW